MQKVTFQTLGRINNGKVGAAIDYELGRMLKDCRERLGNQNPRKLTFTVEMTPFDEESVALGIIIAEPKFPTTKMPAETLRMKTIMRDGEVLGVEAYFADPYQDRLLETVEGVN
jgi:hypothetical protein